MGLNYLLLFEFFTSALADSFSLEFEWQQVSSSFLDSPKYSGRSRKRWSLDGLYSFSYCQVLQSLYQFSGDCTKSTYYNWYYRHFHVVQLFFNSLRSRYLSARTAKSTIRQVLFFFFFFFFFFFLLSIIIRSGRLAEIRRSVFISRSQKNLCVSFSRRNSGWTYTICSYGQIKISYAIPSGSSCPLCRV